MAYHLKKNKNNKFKIARTKDIALLLSLADQKGYFSDHKVDIEFVEIPYARKGLEMMIAGEVDASVLVEANFAYLGYLNPKTPVKSFVSLETRTSDNILMHGKNARPQDLVGAKIGFTPRTSGHTFLIQFLEKHGLTKKDIELKPYSPQALPNALIRKEVDAISLWDPHRCYATTALDELGIEYSHFKNTGFYFSEITMAANKAFLVKNKRTVQNFLKALQDAEKFLKENRDMTRKIINQTMKVPKNFEFEVFERFQPRLQPVNADYLEKIRVIADWIREYDTEFMGKDYPNYKDYIDNSIFLDTITET